MIVSSLGKSSLAAWIANRKEPRPESLVLVTMNGLTRMVELENADESPAAGFDESDGGVTTVAIAVTLDPTGIAAEVAKVNVRFTVPSAGCASTVRPPSNVRPCPEAGLLPKN